MLPFLITSLLRPSGRLEYNAFSLSVPGAVIISPKKADSARPRPPDRARPGTRPASHAPADFHITWECPNCGQTFFGLHPPDLCDYCRDLTTWRRVDR